MKRTPEIRQILTVGNANSGFAGEIRRMLEKVCIKGEKPVEYNPGYFQIEFDGHGPFATPEQAGDFVRRYVALGSLHRLSIQ